MTTELDDDRGVLVPVRRRSRQTDDDGDLAMREWAEELVARARADGVELTGEGGLLTDMVRQVLQTGLEVEMAEHLGYEPHERAGAGRGTAATASMPKTVRPRSVRSSCACRAIGQGTFEPVDGAEVPAPPGRAGGQRDLAVCEGHDDRGHPAHLAEIYGTEVSRETISKITDQIVEDMVAWQSRPLDPLYPVLLIDAIVIKVRDSQVANRPVYVAIGVNLDGERDVLGLWLGPTGGEGAKQWMTMLTELRNRGIADALIVCCDGLKGLPDAIRVTWPKRPCRPASCTWSATACATRRRSTGRRITAAMRDDLHRPDRRRPPRPRSRSSPSEWQETLPGDDPELGDAWNEFVPFLEFPRRAAQDRLHDQRDRVA